MWGTCEALDSVSSVGVGEAELKTIALSLTPHLVPNVLYFTLQVEVWGPAEQTAQRKTSQLQNHAGTAEAQGQ